MGEMDFADTQIEERERENDSFYFFRLVWVKKTKKEKGLLFVFFWDKLILFYYELIILGPYFRGLNFL